MNYTYVTYSCKCTTIKDPIKQDVVEMKNYFCFKCGGQLAMQFE